MDKTEARGLKEQFITFKIGTEIYGIELRESKEIILPPEIKNVPNTGDDIIGVINLRGRVVPVLNFKYILNVDTNTQSTKKNEKRIIITNIEGVLAGFVVDEMNGVINLDSDKAKTQNEEKKKEKYLKWISAEGDTLISIIDLRSVIESQKEVAYD
jgi:chemotaxis signal transduction protein